MHAAGSSDPRRQEALALAGRGLHKWPLVSQGSETPRDSTRPPPPSSCSTCGVRAWRRTTWDTPVALMDAPRSEKAAPMGGGLTPAHSPSHGELVKQRQEVVKFQLYLANVFNSNIAVETPAERPTPGSAQAPLAVAQPGNGGFWLCLPQASGGAGSHRAPGSLARGGRGATWVCPGLSQHPPPPPVLQGPCDGDLESPSKPTRDPRSVTRYQQEGRGTRPARPLPHGGQESPGRPGHSGTP